MSNTESFVAVITLGGRVLHTIGPFDLRSAAVAEARKVISAIDAVGHTGEDPASFCLQTLVPNLGSLLDRVKNALCQ